MQTKEYTQETGKIKTYNLEEELESLVKLNDDKPSKRIIKTKKGRKAIAALHDLKSNHNHSWYQELKQRSVKDPDALALFYRGTKISFSEMFKKADELAFSLAEVGIQKGDTIPVCMANTPELVYLMLAANKIGARLNLFGSHLDKDYLNQILNGCTHKLFIATDDVYSDIIETISKHNYQNKVIVSLADSLPKNPSLTDEYEPKLDSYYHYKNRVNEYKLFEPSIKSFEEFIIEGKNYGLPIFDNNDLDTEFLVTYTSGSTKIGLPKRIIHSNRSLITSGRFHDSELSGNPPLKGLRGLAHIHSESNTDLITCISDNLMQLWSVALEPEYDKKKMLDYLFINKPNYVNAPTGFFIQAAKDYLIEKKFHEDGIGRKLPFLFAAFAVGEGTSKGEEKFINKFLRISRAGSGVKIGKISLPFTTLSIGGGDCEHGGIFYSLWKALYEKMYKFRLKNGEYGMMPESYAHVSVFKPISDDLYTECNYNEYGEIAANSFTTMVGYEDNISATESLIIRDDNGRDWVSNKVYGYIDELGGVHVKGRLNHLLKLEDGSTIAPFMIEDVVSTDTKNILSCTVTGYEDEEDTIPIINIEFQPDKRQSDISILNSILARCANKLPYEISEKAVFRIFDYDKSFPLTGSGKRSVKDIENMGLTDTIKVVDGEMRPYNKISESKQYLKK